MTSAAPEEAPTEGAPAGRTSRSRTFESLSNRSFRWFLLSALGQMASLRVQNIVRGYLAYQLTGSFAALGTVFLANSISGISLNFVGGVWADRLRQRKSLVQVGQLSSAALGVVLGILVYADLLRFEHLLIAGLLIYFVVMRPVDEYADTGSAIALIIEVGLSHDLIGRPVLRQIG